MRTTAKKAAGMRKAYSEPRVERRARRPIDHSYRVVVRTALWGIAGSVFIAFAIWWFYT
jgi:hypothetical protein